MVFSFINLQLIYPKQQMASSYHYDHSHELLPRIVKHSMAGREVSPVQEPRPGLAQNYRISSIGKDPTRINESNAMQEHAVRGCRLP